MSGSTANTDRTGSTTGSNVVPLIKPVQHRTKSSPMVPSITAEPSSLTQENASTRSGSAPIGSAGSDLARRKVSPSLMLPSSPHRSPRSPPASRQNSLRGSALTEEQAQVDVELQKYQEDEEDWDVDFEREGAFGKLSLSDRIQQPVHIHETSLPR
jgi:hypothetical protein